MPIEEYEKLSAARSAASDTFKELTASLQTASDVEMLAMKEPLLKLQAGMGELIAEMDKHTENNNADLANAIEQRDSIKAQLLAAVMAA